MKLRNKSVKSTILIYCEGKRDEIFIRHLHKLYKSSKLNHFFMITQGDGGSPEKLVIKANRRPGQFDRKFVLCDGDRDIAELQNAKKLATDCQIELIVFDICLEATLLQILDPALNCHGWHSRDYKRYFEQQYIPRDKRIYLDRYDIFSRSSINKASEHNKVLNSLLQIFQA